MIALSKEELDKHLNECLVRNSMFDIVNENLDEGIKWKIIHCIDQAKLLNSAVNKDVDDDLATKKMIEELQRQMLLEEDEELAKRLQNEGNIPQDDDNNYSNRDN